MRIDANSWDFMINKVGKVVSSGTHVVPKDGRTITCTRRGVTATGHPTSGAAIYEMQQRSRVFESEDTAKNFCRLTPKDHSALEVGGLYEALSHGDHPECVDNIGRSTVVEPSQSEDPAHRGRTRHLELKAETQLSDLWVVKWGADE